MNHENYETPPKTHSENPAAFVFSRVPGVLQGSRQGILPDGRCSNGLQRVLRNRIPFVHLAAYTRTMTRVILVLWIFSAAQAQTQAPAAPTLEKLLAEVHQLRLALERSAQIAPRIQIAVERLKLQQEKVARTSQPLDELRRDLDRRRSDQPKIQQRLQAIENQASQAVDPTQRRDFEGALKEFKLEAEQAEKSLQQMQAREGELTGQLQAEQSRFMELNDRLDQIERALSVP